MFIFLITQPHQVAWLVKLNELPDSHVTKSLLLRWVNVLLANQPIMIYVFCIQDRQKYFDRFQKTIKKGKLNEIINKSSIF